MSAPKLLAVPYMLPPSYSCPRTCLKWLALPDPCACCLLPMLLTHPHGLFPLFVPPSAFPLCPRHGTPKGPGHPLGSSYPPGPTLTSVSVQNYISSSIPISGLASLSLLQTRTLGLALNVHSHPAYQSLVPLNLLIVLSTSPLLPSPQPHPGRISYTRFPFSPSLSPYSGPPTTWQPVGSS